MYNYFRDAQGAVVVFDLTDESSLEEAKVWLRQIMLHCDCSIPLILLGNKADLFNQEELTIVL